MSAENVAIVKSSWAGWRQQLEDQMTRDFESGVADAIAAWEAETGRPDLQPEEFVDAGDVVLVRARELSHGRALRFLYTLAGARIVGWEVEPDS